MIPNNWFYRLMYRKKIVKFKADSGRVYIVEYDRIPFWTYDDRTLKVFFTEKFNHWYGYVWEVFENGGRAGFGGQVIITYFPRRKMKKYLLSQVKWLEKIFDGSDTE